MSGLYAGELTVTTEGGTTIVTDDGTRKWKFFDDMVWGPKQWYHTSVGSGSENLISSGVGWEQLWGIETEGRTTDAPVLLESSPTRARVLIKDGSNFTITTVYPTGQLYQDYSVNYGSNSQEYAVHRPAAAAPEVSDRDDTNNTVVFSDSSNNNYAGISMIPYTSSMGVTGTLTEYDSDTYDQHIFYKGAALNGSGQILFDASNYRATTTTRDNARDDYRTPGILANFNTGSGGWFDGSENTSSPDDFFNETEGTYSIEMSSSQRLVFDLTGAGYSFSDGFEDGLVPPWDAIWEGTAGDDISQSTDYAHTGTYSAKSITDTQNPAQACVLKDIQSSSTLWVRMYIYLTNSFPPANNVTFLHTTTLTPAWDHLFTLAVKSDMKLLLGNFPGSDWYESTNTISTGSWQYIETKFVVSPTAGELKVWLNGTLEINQTNIDTGSLNIERVEAGIFWQDDGTDANTLYIDDVVIEGGAAATNRYSPVFKIRNYRSLSDPQAVYKNTTALANGTDYNSDIMPFTEAWYYNGSTYTKLAAGGLSSSSDEYLARSNNNYTLNFSTSLHYLYLGSSSKFQGVNIDLSTLGSGTSPVIQWQYWNGAWTNLSVSETSSGAKNFLADGCVYFTQPGDWTRTTVNGGTNLFFVRAYISSGSYSTPPVENLIKTDILLLQVLSTITDASTTFSFIGPTAVDLVSFEARQYDELVLLEWRTAHEVRNLGFNVYREENGELSRLNPELIAGSAFLAGSVTPLTAGHHYTWLDNSITSDQLSAVSTQRSAVGGRRSVVRYYLEDVDLNGKKTWHGPVEVRPLAPRSPLSASDFRRAELLSEFGARLQEKYADFWRAQDFREKLAKKPIKSASILKGRKTQHSGPRAQDSGPRAQDSGLRTHDSVVGGRRSAVGGPRANVSVSSVDDRNEAPAGRMTSARLSDKPLKQCQEVQQALAARPAMKLLVKEEGWYRVSQGELAAAGMNTNFNPKHLHLYADGNELPLRVITEKENRFGPRDAIEFYGIGLDTPSTDTRVYWLVLGSRPGKRMPVSRAQGGQASLEAFPYTAESKERSFYFPSLLNGEDPNFFGPLIYTYRVDQLIYVWDADLGSREDALLEVALQGATAGPHRVKVFFNDLEVGEVSFSGQSQARFQAEIPVSVLQPGENLVSFIAHGGEMDVSFLDYIHLTYWRNYRAHENALKLTAQGGRQVSVTGFSHPQVQVVDITDPLSVVAVEGKVSKAQDSGYEVSFRVPQSGMRTLLALSGDKVKTPAKVVLNQPSLWHQRENGYDLVIISHKDFLEILKPLKTLREAQGLSVALVDVEDVYDEFSFGSKDPQGIKDFLQRAESNWQKPPRFVLLVGDSSYDPRNFLGYGELDFVPTKLLDTEYLETASDDWLVDLNGDGLPDMALGRLPVQTQKEASAVVAKIIAYERSSGTNEALLVADKMEMTDGFNFASAVRKVKALFPSSVSVKEVFRGDYSNDSQVREVLLGYLSKGSLLVNYIGHGGMGEWRGLIFTSQDADGLSNGMRLPFFVNMTCLNGFFQAPYGDSIAEVLLKAEQGGAVAVWTSSGMTFPTGQAAMNQELVRQLFNGEGLTIGEAAMKAKRATSDKDIRRTWIFFGDPTTRLK